jgi:hypothetical protein
VWRQTLHYWLAIFPAYSLAGGIAAMADNEHIAAYLREKNAQSHDHTPAADEGSTEVVYGGWRRCVGVSRIVFKGGGVVLVSVGSCSKHEFEVHLCCGSTPIIRSNTCQAVTNAIGC